MEITTYLDLDFSYSSPPKTVHAHQLDKSTRKVIIRPYNDNAPYSIPSGVTARVKAGKPDFTYVLDDCEINSSGQVVITLTDQILAVAGNVKCSVALYQGETILSTSRFLINVHPNEYDDSYVESSDEFNALLNALAKVDNLDVWAVQTDTGFVLYIKDKDGVTTTVTCEITDARMMAICLALIQAHPEWVTTIQDGSVTRAKLHSDLEKSIGKLEIEDTTNNKSYLGYLRIEDGKPCLYTEEV